MSRMCVSVENAFALSLEETTMSPPGSLAIGTYSASSLWYNY